MSVQTGPVPTLAFSKAPNCVPAARVRSWLTYRTCVIHTTVGLSSWYSWCIRCAIVWRSWNSSWVTRCAITIYHPYRVQNLNFFCKSSSLVVLSSLIVLCGTCPLGSAFQLPRSCEYDNWRQFLNVCKLQKDCEWGYCIFRRNYFSPVYLWCRALQFLACALQLHSCR